jgi:hypothetical protein
MPEPFKASKAQHPPNGRFWLARVGISAPDLIIYKFDHKYQINSLDK